jgi:hypothetical protein
LSVTRAAKPAGVRRIITDACLGLAERAAQFEAIIARSGS